jgi:deoxyribose-phosphate aldolase
MLWDDVIRHYTQVIQPVKITRQVLTQLLGCLDLTSLNDDDSDKGISEFSNQAILDLGHVAALCVYPRFVALLADQFKNTPVKIATVVNFPGGNLSEVEVLRQIAGAIQDGAQEIDVVLPYHTYLAGEREAVQSFISSCKLACSGGVLLKVILETGALNTPEMIANASSDAIRAGADFLKTSTGKIPQGATIEAAIVMLMTIKQLQPSLARPVGLKVSGGIREVSQALQYASLARQVMGEAWVTPATFRIGASKLVDEIVKVASSIE